MADTLLVILPATLPEGTCWPSDPDAYQKLILGLARVKLPSSSGGGVVIGQNAPASTDWDKIWHRTDSSGNLIRSYTHGGYGMWVSPHPVPPGSLTRVIYTGTEASLLTYEEGVDEPVTPVTGPFWEVDHAFDFKIPMGVGTNGDTFDGNPATALTLGQNMGEERHILTGNEFVGPGHKHPIGKFQTGSGAGGDNGIFIVGTAVPAITGTGNEVDGVGGSPITRDFSTLTGPDMVSNGVNDPQTIVSHQNLPPVRGAFYIKRTARQYWTIA